VRRLHRVRDQPGLQLRSMSYQYPGRITFFECDDGQVIPMRSRLEVRWATFFAAAQLAWEYEPETFTLSNQRCYTPDFYLPEVGWIEIKATPEDAEKAEAKLRLFAHERDQLIDASRRKDFYTICGALPGFGIHTFHRWDPAPTEIYWAEDIYLLFSGTETRKTAARVKLHPIEWLKCCLAQAWRPIEPLRPLEEYVVAYRHHETGTSFQRLSRHVRAGTILPLTNREIEQLQTPDGHLKRSLVVDLVRSRLRGGC
jgi:hypothetical protein